MTGLNEASKRLEKGGHLIGIIGEHFLWTLKYWNHDAPNKLEIIGNETEFIKKVFSSPFRKTVMACHGTKSL